MGRLDDRIALVSGSDSGIGKAIAAAFAKEGADIIVTYHSDEDGAKDTVRLVEHAGRKAVIIQLDQSNPESVNMVFDEAERQFGKPDILVNNAGTGSGKIKIKELSDEDWDRVIKTDLYGPFYMTRRFLKSIEGKENGARIINITSVHEDIPSPGSGPYCAAKAGLRNLTRVLALELADSGANVNNIAPGMVLTPMNKEAIKSPEQMEKQVENIPVKRPASPEEIAQAAVYLASEESGFIQGESLFIDGGQRWALGQGA